MTTSQTLREELGWVQWLLQRTLRSLWAGCSANDVAHILERFLELVQKGPSMPVEVALFWSVSFSYLEEGFQPCSSKMSEAIKDIPNCPSKLLSSNKIMDEVLYKYDQWTPGKLSEIIANDQGMLFMARLDKLCADLKVPPSCKRNIFFRLHHNVFIQNNEIIKYSLLYSNHSTWG